MDSSIKLVHCSTYGYRGIYLRENIKSTVDSSTDATYGREQGKEEETFCPSTEEGSLKIFTLVTHLGREKVFSLY